MSRFFVPAEAVKGNIITIGGVEAHHIIDVMRLRISDKVVTFDGTGKEYTGVIKNISRGSLTVEIISTRVVQGKETFRIALLQALPKKEKMDYIVEKATELGAGSINPVITERTIPDWTEAKMVSRSERWRKIAKEAAKQCGRADIPEVLPVESFADSIGRFADFDLKLIAILNEEAVPVKDAIKGSGSGKVVIAIGPEGDFSPNEAKIAKESGFKPISLGPRVLKSDTAGLALLSILNYEFTN
ncbi:MAG: 16S rRNA (uracil(1498)-N(3))-methyltransferase [Candidatus Omnitrophica bacterium]|nr:16S rRNA (uracil(1498)-N(3))-methyltransferase [Candidatus Omnitrophota bacterium]